MILINEKKFCNLFHFFHTPPPPSNFFPKPTPFNFLQTLNPKP